MKVLLTGFQPFGGETMNPAWEAVADVKEEICGAQIVKVQVPVTFADAIPVVYEAMKREQPDVVICVGQAGGRSAITPERVAINVDDARIAYNGGATPTDEPIFADGENAYFSTLPIKKIVEAIRAESIPAAVSNTAGTYVCNHIMYGVLYYIQKEFPGMTGGFIHVPFCTEQVLDKSNMPSMSLENITRGLEAAVRATVE